MAVLELILNTCPRILSIGPTFKILGQATGTLDIGVDMKVDLSYTVNGAKLFFPPSDSHPSGGEFSPSNNRKSPLS